MVCEICFCICVDLLDWLNVGVDCNIEDEWVSCLNWIKGGVEEEWGIWWRVLWRGMWSGVWIELIWIVGIDFWGSVVLGRNLKCKVMEIFEEWMRLGILIEVGCEEEFGVIVFCEVGNVMKERGSCNCCIDVCWVL